MPGCGGSRTSNGPLTGWLGSTLAAPLIAPRKGFVVGDKVITVEFTLGGFAGPSAIGNFDSERLVMEMVAATSSWAAITGHEITGERFEGENTERFQVREPEFGPGLSIIDTVEQYTVFEANHLDSSVVDAVCKVLNDSHP